MRTEIKRYIPVSVRRQLRREACFGCAKCGSPILEYHHIIQFAQDAHHRPEDMIALCPTCHRSLGKMHPDKCYELKRKPHNREAGKIRGELGTVRQTTCFLVGSNTFIDQPVIFSYFSQPIIRYCIEAGQALLDIYIPKNDMWPDILITKNDLMVNSDDKWDIEFRTNFLRVEKDDRRSFFQINLRKERAEIDGCFEIRGEEFCFTPASTTFGNTSVKNCTFVKNSGAGIAIGDGTHRLHWPNYAMIQPKAVFHPI